MVSMSFMSLIWAAARRIAIRTLRWLSLCGKGGCYAVRAAARISAMIRKAAWRGSVAAMMGRPTTR